MVLYCIWTKWNIAIFKITGNCICTLWKKGLSSSSPGVQVWKRRRIGIGICSYHTTIKETGVTHTKHKQSRQRREPTEHKQNPPQEKRTRHVTLRKQQAQKKKAAPNSDRYGKKATPKRPYYIHSIIIIVYNIFDRPAYTWKGGLFTNMRWMTLTMCDDYTLKWPSWSVCTKTKWKELCSVPYVVSYDYCSIYYGMHVELWQRVILVKGLVHLVSFSVT